MATWVVGEGRPRGYCQKRKCEGTARETRMKLSARSASATETWCCAKCANNRCIQPMFLTTGCLTTVWCLLCSLQCTLPMQHVTTACAGAKNTARRGCPGIDLPSTSAVQQKVITVASAGSSAMLYMRERRKQLSNNRGRPAHRSQNRQRRMNVPALFTC